MASWNVLVVSLAMKVIESSAAVLVVAKALLCGHSVLVNFLSSYLFPTIKPLAVIWKFIGTAVSLFLIFGSAETSEVMKTGYKSPYGSLSPLIETP